MKTNLAILLIVFAFSSLADATQPSADFRKDKKFSPTFGYGFDHGYASTQLTGEYFLDSDSLVGLQVGRFDNGETRIFYFAPGFKQFVTNSFYLKPSIFFRDYKSGNDTNSYYNSAHQKLGVSFVIGNQWQWKYLTLGCDWIGLNMPVIKIKEEGRNDRRDFYVTSLRFFIGASF